MPLFKYSNKPGPGVPTNGEKKCGIALFIQVVKENFFQLVLLNLFFILCCIPFVTIGPAFKALDKVTMNFVRHVPTSPIRDFIDEFKEGFVKSMITGLVIIILLALCVVGYILIPSQGQSEKGLYLTGGIALLVVLFILSISMYIFKSLGTIDLPVGTTVKNAFLLTLMSLKELVLIFVLTVLPSFIIANIVYVGVPLYLVWMFVYNSLVSSLIGWNVIKRYIVLEDADTSENKVA